MEKSDKQEQKKKIPLFKTFTVPFSLGGEKENITINTNTPSKPSKEQIINLAIDLHSKGNIQEADKYYKYIIDQGINDFSVLSNYGSLLMGLGKLDDAEFYLHKAIEIKPDFAEGYANLGTILMSLGKLEEAKTSQIKSIKLKPNLPLSHYNLGNILQALGELDQAESSYKRSINLNCQNSNLYKNLGQLYLHKGDYLSALSSFRKCFDLQRGTTERNINNQESFRKISKAKIDHDIEQFEYLASKSINSKLFIDLATIYKSVSTQINWPSITEIIFLDDINYNLIKDSYNLCINRKEARKLDVSSINEYINFDSITSDYFDHDYGATFIDDFLSPEALLSLREFFLESTIWFSIRGGGYLGSSLEEGIASPLIFQIAEELRQRFPRIFQDHHLKYAWAFKYDSRSKMSNTNFSGINVHADEAAINVNFWITPSEANLNPDSGGLIIYNHEAPKDWDFNSFNQDIIKIEEELTQSNRQKTVIPYKENRAVLFNSNLFHETDTYEFKEGYENRRINVTMLFGDRRNA